MSIKEGTDNADATQRNEKVDKEIMALIQIVNGLNEVDGDDVSFDRVYEYIKARYGERERRKNEMHRATMAFCVMISDCLNLTKATLVDLRQSLTLHPDTRTEVLVSKIDSALKEIGATFNEKTLGELDAYKVYKEVMKESA
jgi:hypothetical protein